MLHCPGRSITHHAANLSVRGVILPPERYVCNTINKPEAIDSGFACRGRKEGGILIIPKKGGGRVCSQHLEPVRHEVPQQQ